MAVHTLAAVSYLVRDYDEAIAWFQNALGFSVVEDVPQGEGKRWVKVQASPGQAGFILAKAVGETQISAIGHAAGGRVAYFLYTDDFSGSHQKMMAAGVRFREKPRHEAYGIVAVFEDIYGNGWDLIEPA